MVDDRTAASAAVFVSGAAGSRARSLGHAVDPSLEARSRLSLPRDGPRERLWTRRLAKRGSGNLASRRSRQVRSTPVRIGLRHAQASSAGRSLRRWRGGKSQVRRCREQQLAPPNGRRLGTVLQGRGFETKPRLTRDLALVRPDHPADIVSAAVAEGWRRLPGTVSRQEPRASLQGCIHGVSSETRCSLRATRRGVLAAEVSRRNQYKSMG